MSDSFERQFETWAIQQCTAAIASGSSLFSALTGIQLRHHDDAADADPTRIFFEAVQGEQDPSFQGNPEVAIYVMMLTAEYRTTNTDATVTDPIFAALLKVFTTPVFAVAANAYFGPGLWFEQEVSTDARTDGQNTRNRSRTYEFRVGQTP